MAGDGGRKAAPSPEAGRSPVIIRTPSLSVKTVKVFPPLFKAQLPDTLSAIREAIPEWTAVHVVLEQAGGARRGPEPEEMCDELLGKLAPLAMLYEPIYTLTTPEVPEETLATFVPDEFKPKFATEHQGWKYLYCKEARARLKGLFDAALEGGMPEGNVGVADALTKGRLRGKAVLEGWNMSMPLPSFRRTVEAMVDPGAPVMLWDTAFGHETTGEKFLEMSPQILSGMLDVKNDRLYFDAANFSWFVVIYPGGQVLVAALG